MPDVIFTPVYEETRYLYHECSECQYHIRMEPSVLTPIYFGESFKFCPNCGKPVIRFAKLPKFKENFDRTIFKDLIEFDKEYDDKLDYYCRIELTQAEFDELKKKCRFAVQLQKNGDTAVLSPAVIRVAEMSSKPWNHWNIKKLKEKVEKRCDTK